MKLAKYLDHKVIVKLKSGKMFVGEVNDYEHADESDKNMEFIGIDTLTEKYPVGIYEDEIESIEIM